MTDERYESNVLQFLIMFSYSFSTSIDMDKTDIVVLVGLIMSWMGKSWQGTPLYLPVMDLFEPGNSTLLTAPQTKIRPTWNKSGFGQYLPS
jgi:hypothetical protein